jgi:hypothetical protein
MPALPDMDPDEAALYGRWVRENAPISPAQRKALMKAASRERANICPVIGVHAAAEQSLIEALDRRGFILWDGPVPRISDAGRKAVESHRAWLARRTAELRGKEPEPTSMDVAFDARILRREGRRQ